MKHSHKRAVWILTPVLIVGLLGGFAWSHRGGGPGGERSDSVRGEYRKGPGDRHHGKRQSRRDARRDMSRTAQELGLNEEQVEAIENVLLEARKTNIKLIADARVARIELGQLITGDEVDKASVNAKVDQLASLRGAIMRQRAEAVLAVREILTPEQQAKADRMLQRLLHGPRGHRGR